MNGRHVPRPVCDSFLSGAAARASDGCSLVQPAFPWTASLERSSRRCWPVLRPLWGGELEPHVGDAAISLGGNKELRACKAQGFDLFKKRKTLSSTLMGCLGAVSPARHPLAPFPRSPALAKRPQPLCPPPPPACASMWIELQGEVSAPAGRGEAALCTARGRRDVIAAL